MLSQPDWLVVTRGRGHVRELVDRGPEVDSAGQVLPHGGAGTLLLGHNALAAVDDLEEGALGDERHEQIDAGVAVVGTLGRAPWEHSCRSVLMMVTRADNF